MSPFLPPATAAVRAGVRTLLSQELDRGGLRAGDLVLVACSGGADSLALAAGTAFVAPRLGLRAGAISVDHSMQAGSRAVSQQAISQCRSLGLDPARVAAPDGGGCPGQESTDAQGAGAQRSGAPQQPRGRSEGSGGPEGRARELRYRVLQQALRDTGAAAVLLGHTLDDQAETVLLALGRGSGARAMAGMASVRGPYLRPLLGVSREQTRAACTEAELQPWQDPANAPDGPWRSASGGPLPRAALRAEVLPALRRALGPGVLEALGRTAELARADADLLDEQAADLHARLQVGSTGQVSPDDVVLEVAGLTDQPDALRSRVLRLAAIGAGSRPGALNYGHVQLLDALVRSYRGQGPIALPGPVWAHRRYGTLVLSAARPHRRPPAGTSPAPPAEQER